MGSNAKSQLGIIVYRGWKDTGAYVWSPFVTKLEARLRFAGLPYKTDVGSMGKSPRGKIPYVALSKPGTESAPTLVSDTTLIVAKLVDEGVMDNLNATLAPADQAHDLALRALVEDKLYWYNGYEKWHENYYTMRDKAMWAIPYPIRVAIGLLAYRGVTATMHGQGTGRFTTEEIGAFKHEAWESIDALLTASKQKNKKIDAVFWALGGKGPSEADATLFGAIASSLVCAATPDSKRMLKSLPAVMDYAKRIHEQYFSDYALWD